jgi:hypothetical protein
MFPVIGVGELADHNAAAGTRVDEASVLEIDTRVRGLSPFLDVEEDQISFIELPFATEMPIAAIVDVLDLPRKVHIVDLSVDLADETRTIDPALALSPITVRRSAPFIDFRIKFQTLQIGAFYVQLLRIFAPQFGR